MIKAIPFCYATAFVFFGNSLKKTEGKVAVFLFQNLLGFGFLAPLMGTISSTFNRRGKGYRFRF